MEESAATKLYESIYSGALSLAGFVLAIFLYSFIEYRKYTGLAQGEFPAIIPIFSALLMMVCGSAAIIGFVKTHQGFDSWIKWPYVAVLSSLILMPLLVWLFG